MSTEGAVNSSSEIASIDWNLCIFCQSKTSLDLECPAKSKKDDSGKGYLTLVNILNEFQNARALLNGFDHDILNADTLKEQSASWHKAWVHQSMQGPIQQHQAGTGTKTERPGNEI